MVKVGKQDPGPDFPNGGNGGGGATIVGSQKWNVHFLPETYGDADVPIGKVGNFLIREQISDFWDRDEDEVLTSQSLNDLLLRLHHAHSIGTVISVRLNLIHPSPNQGTNGTCKVTCAGVLLHF
jgi:hypothetical protein